MEQNRGMPESPLVRALEVSIKADELQADGKILDAGLLHGETAFLMGEAAREFEGSTVNDALKAQREHHLMMERLCTMHADNLSRIHRAPEDNVKVVYKMEIDGEKKIFQQCPADLAKFLDAMRFLQDSTKKEVGLLKNTISELKNFIQDVERVMPVQSPQVCPHCEKEIEIATIPRPPCLAAPADPTQAATAPADPTQAVTAPADPTQPVTAPADPTQATTAPADLTQAATTPADPTQAATAPADPTQAATAPADPTQAATAPADPTQAATAPADSTQATTALADPTQAATAPQPHSAATASADLTQAATAPADLIQAATASPDVTSS